MRWEQIWNSTPGVWAQLQNSAYHPLRHLPTLVDGSRVLWFHTTLINCSPVLGFKGAGITDSYQVSQQVPSKSDFCVVPVCKMRDGQGKRINHNQTIGQGRRHRILFWGRWVGAFQTRFALESLKDICCPVLPCTLPHPQCAFPSPTLNSCIFIP